VVLRRRFESVEIHRIGRGKGRGKRKRKRKMEKEEESEIGRESEESVRVRE
jgi:hypothetical protein